MRLRNWLVLAVGLCLGAADPKGDVAKALEEMQGTWSAIGHEEGGKKSPEADAKKLDIFFPQIWPVSGYTFPDEVAQEILDQVGPFRQNPGRDALGVIDVVGIGGRHAGEHVLVGLALEQVAVLHGRLAEVGQQAVAVPVELEGRHQGERDTGGARPGQVGAG